jgi:hypothetical protein
MIDSELETECSIHFSSDDIVLLMGGKGNLYLKRVK